MLAAYSLTALTFFATYAGVYLLLGARPADGTPLALSAAGKACMFGFVGLVPYWQGRRWKLSQERKGKAKAGGLEDF